jgi:hypothetical protein
VARVLWVVLSYKSAFFKYNPAFVVYSGQLLARRNASTVARDLWIRIRSREVGSGLGEAMVNGFSCRN